MGTVNFMLLMQVSLANLMETGWDYIFANMGVQFC